MDDRSEFLALIESNINKFGYHVTIVNSPLEPRYAYTVGLIKSVGFELIFAGGIYYMKNEILTIIDAFVKEFKKEKRIITGKIIKVESLGSFSLGKVELSWSKLTMLGVFDYYKLSHFEAFQIIPDSKHYTKEIPNMSKEFQTSSSPIWQWLIKEWHYPVPSKSNVITNINSLYGETITEVMRWEEDEWEMFAGAGPDVKDEDKRVVSLGTIIGIDKSLECVTELEIGKGIWRDPQDLIWHKWG